MEMLDYGLFQLCKNYGVFETPYDVTETDEQIIFKMGVPGLKEKDVDIRIRDGKRLLIRSIKTSKFTKEFSFVFTLPCMAIREETYATVKDGVLTVCIKKDEPNEFRVTLK